MFLLLQAVEQHVLPCYGDLGMVGVWWDRGGLKKAKVEKSEVGGFLRGAVYAVVRVVLLVFLFRRIPLGEGLRVVWW